MSSCWNDVKGGYKEIVKANKEAPGKCTFTVAAFDSEYDLLEDFTDIQNVNENLRVVPRGMTALLDAIGKTINSVGEKLAALAEEDRPAKICMIVQTDGQENASKEFTKDSVKKMIDTQTNVFNWQFQFIGATLESVNEAQSLGFSKGNTTNYNTGNSLNTFSLVGAKLCATRNASMGDYVSTCAFTEDERTLLNEKKD